MGNFFAGNQSKPTGNALIAGALSQLPEIAQAAAVLNGGDKFNTIPVTNLRRAFYALSIRSPSPPYLAYSTYIFPLSPSMIRKEYIALSNAFDVQGTPNQNGVRRIIDQYGNTPVVYSIEGTTGWQRHATDGYGSTGIQSILQLQEFLNLYAELNQTQGLNNKPPYRMEFYDYFTGEFWQIEPIGKQMVSQSEKRPLLIDYSLRWAGIRSLSSPVQDAIDALLEIIQSPAQLALGTVGNVLGRFLRNYAQITPGSSNLIGRLL